MPNIASPGSGELELLKRIEALEKGFEKLDMVLYTADNIAGLQNFYCEIRGNNIFRVARMTGYNSTDKTLNKYGDTNYYVIGKVSGANCLNSPVNQINILGKYYVAVNNPYTIKILSQYYCVFDGTDTIILIGQNVFTSGYINTFDAICFI